MLPDNLFEATFSQVSLSLIHACTISSRPFKLFNVQFLSLNVHILYMLFAWPCS